ncbi:MAG: hypothetical protein ACI4O7_13560 [Aristaeellaceae bacterium]
MAQGFLQSIKGRVTEKRGVSFWFLIASLACSLTMLAAYTQTGTNTFTPVLSGKVLAMMKACIALGAAMAVVEIKNGKYLLYLLFFWTWLEFLVYNASYIANVLVGIDGNLFSAGFLLTAGAGLLGWALTLVSAIVQKREIGSRGVAEKHLQAEE